jgi:hypothetical protein
MYKQEGKMLKSLMSGIAVAAACSFIFITGCSYYDGYDTNILPPLQVEERVDGEAFIYMPAEEVDWVYSGNPTNFADRATTYTAPIGYITQQVAVRAFSQHFLTVNTTSKLLEMADYQYTIQPRIMSFEYTYNCPKGLGAITPEVLLKVYVRVYGSDGQLLLDRIYASGRFKGTPCPDYKSPSEKINAALHQALWALMNNAAADIKSVVL